MDCLGGRRLHADGSHEELIWARQVAGWEVGEYHLSGCHVLEREVIVCQRREWA